MSTKKKQGADKTALSEDRIEDREQAEELEEEVGEENISSSAPADPVITGRPDGAIIENPGNSGVRDDQLRVGTDQLNPDLNSADREYRRRGQRAATDPSKFVTVRLANDVKSFMGNKAMGKKAWVVGKAGEVISVTEAQREILRNAGHLAAL
jgi:hypothetical protein